MMRSTKYIINCLTRPSSSNILFYQNQLSEPNIGLPFFINRYSGIERCKTYGSERKLLRPLNKVIELGLEIDPIEKHISWMDWINDKIHNTIIKGFIIKVENNENFWTDCDLQNKPYVS